MATGILAATLVAAAISGSGAAPAEVQLAANNVITLRVCNHTSNPTLIGSSFIPIGGKEWRNKGWTKVNAGACRDIFTTTNRTFYARAEVQGHSDEFWGTDIKQCIEYPGPYDFMTGSNDTTCPEGEPAEFTTFHSDGRPVYVWNLNP
ncbi:MAG TPA: DUF1036 domain-containing protein [Rhizomicrobium sp.]|jgi:uncharacterized membrane protein|nr:DUF1036 domain-containing protein [Rhizomicrobium sp.]